MTAIRFDLISETIDCAGASEAKDRSELTAVSELILHRLSIRSVDGYKTPQVIRAREPIRYSRSSCITK
jgi:hypothetical protein